MGLPGRARGGTENESTASGFPSPSGAASGSVPWATERRWRGVTCDRGVGAEEMVGGR